MKRVAFVVALVAAPALAHAACNPELLAQAGTQAAGAGPVGTWCGSFEVSGTTWDAVLTVKPAATGQYTATIAENPRQRVLISKDVPAHKDNNQFTLQGTGDASQVTYTFSTDGANMKMGRSYQVGAKSRYASGSLQKQ